MKSRAEVSRGYFKDDLGVASIAATANDSWNSAAPARQAFKRSLGRLSL